MHLKVPLLLVLGHEGCGAVKAALESKGDSAGGALSELIGEIEPAVKSTLTKGKEVDEVMHEAVYATVRYTITRILELSPVIAAAVRKGDLLVKGAVYSLSTSEVTILEEG